MPKQQKQASLHNDLSLAGAGSHALQDYIKAIFKLQQGDEGA